MQEKHSICRPLPELCLSYATGILALEMVPLQVAGAERKNMMDTWTLAAEADFAEIGVLLVECCVGWLMARVDVFGRTWLQI